MPILIFFSSIRQRYGTGNSRSASRTLRRYRYSADCHRTVGTGSHRPLHRRRLPVCVASAWVRHRQRQQHRRTIFESSAASQRSPIDTKCGVGDEETDEGDAGRENEILHPRSRPNDDSNRRRRKRCGWRHEGWKQHWRRYKVQSARADGVVRLVAWDRTDGFRSCLPDDGLHRQQRRLPDPFATAADSIC